MHGARSGRPEFVTVGGDSSATILEYDGTQWHNVMPDPTLPPLVGVYVRNPYQAYAVGYEGTVLQRKGAAWKLLDTGQELFNPFHSVLGRSGRRGLGGGRRRAEPDAERRHAAAPRERDSA